MKVKIVVIIGTGILTIISIILIVLAATWKTELVETKTELAETKTHLTKTESQLVETKTQLSDTENQLAGTKEELAETKGYYTNRISHERRTLKKSSEISVKILGDVSEHPNVYNAQTLKEDAWGIYLLAISGVAPLKEKLKNFFNAGVYIKNFDISASMQWDDSNRANVSIMIVSENKAFLEKICKIIEKNNTLQIEY